MIALRRLAPEEFPLLSGLHEGFQPDPKQSIAIVAQRGDEYVGRIFLLQPTHMEGPWIREDCRGGSLGGRLIREIESQAKHCGITKLFAYAGDAKIESYLSRLGYERSPMTVWEKGL